MKKLMRIFVKNSDDLSDCRVRNAYGTVSSIIGIVLNALLSAAKIATGALTGAISVIADGINNLSDTASSGISLVGFKLSSRPADKEHPFGHARMEYVSALIIAFLIIFVGVQLAITSIENIISASAPTFSIVTVIVLAVSIAVKMFMALFYRSNARLIQSATLKACALDSLNDCLATLIVIAAIVISRYTGVALDGYAGAAIAIYIAFSGLKLAAETLSPILGEKPDPKLVQEIVDKARSYNGILGVHDLVFHNYGKNKYFISFHAEVDAKADLMTTHELIDTIESDLMSDNVHVVIHMDPIITDDPRINALKEMVQRIIAEISPNLNIHDFRAIIGPNRKNLIFDLLLPDYTSYDKDTIVKIISERITEENPACHAVISVDYPLTDIA